MTVIDGSTGRAAPENALAEPDTPRGTFDDLRAALAEQEEIEPITVPVHGIPLRLVCLPDITSKQLGNWQRKALPPHLRTSSQVSPLAMDQRVLATAVLVNTCLRVEVRNSASGQWRTITDQDGEPLTLADDALLRELGAMDTPTALRKLFPLDANLQKASRQVLTASGWDEEAGFGEEDGENPTD